MASVGSLLVETCPYKSVPINNGAATADGFVMEMKQVLLRAGSVLLHTSKASVLCANIGNLKEAQSDWRSALSMRITGRRRGERGVH